MARRRFPESFKRETVDQALAGTPLCHLADDGIAESLLGKWKLRSARAAVHVDLKRNGTESTSSAAASLNASP
jgi:transposase-like protein